MIKNIVFKKIILFSIFSVFSVFSFCGAYTLGIFSQSKTVQEIIDIESIIHPYQIPVAAFIFDNYIGQGSLIVNTIVNKLGTGRVYHITLSPDHYTAQQVASGSFDEEYLAFFNDIKKYNLKVLFRTMHEMNGGWYARSSDPKNFQLARERVRKLSRKAGLDENNIQFIFSFNRADMPLNREKVKMIEEGKNGEVYVPNQKSPLIACTQKMKKKIGCHTREDYYPDPHYVDIIGFSIYNWGKATSNRQWQWIEDIVYDPSRDNRTRVARMGKPLYIDEIGTTAIRYDEQFDRAKSQEMYTWANKSKNARLRDLANFANKHKEILGMNYFNVDYTMGLRDWSMGEADWKIIDPEKGILYKGAQDLLSLEQSKDIHSIFRSSNNLYKGSQSKLIRRQDKFKNTIEDGKALGSTVEITPKLSF